LSKEILFESGLRKMHLLLASGIPLSSKNSFYWQLTLLNDGLKRKGINTTLISPVPSNKKNLDGKIKEGIFFTDYRKKDSLKLLKADLPNAIILLGYPDEFPFLSELPNFINIYLWAQFSHPPDLDDFFSKRIIFVPLTKKTAEYCTKAGAKNVLDPIPHGISTEIYRPLEKKQKIAIRNEMELNIEFIVGTVAKNILRKRLNDVIEAFSRASMSIENSLLLIKTDKTTSDAGYDLIYLAKRYGIYNKIRIIKGDFDRYRMSELYNCMDAYVQLSEWEGFGIPVIEAMSCGVPVVTHNVQGPGELVGDGGIVVDSFEYIDDTGAVLSRADIGKVSEALCLIHRDELLKTKLSENAIKIARDKYNISRIVDRWLEIIE